MLYMVDPEAAAAAHAAGLGQQLSVAVGGKYEGAVLSLCTVIYCPNWATIIGKTRLWYG